MAKSSGGGYGCFTLLIVALIAHSCGEDAGRSSAQSRARRELETAENSHRLEKHRLQSEIDRLRGDCPAETR